MRAERLGTASARGSEDGLRSPVTSVFGEGARNAGLGFVADSPRASARAAPAAPAAAPLRAPAVRATPPPRGRGRATSTRERKRRASRRRARRSTCPSGGGRRPPGGARSTTTTCRRAASPCAPSSRRAPLRRRRSRRRTCAAPRVSPPTPSRSAALCAARSPPPSPPPPCTSTTSTSGSSMPSPLRCLVVHHQLVDVESSMTSAGAEVRPAQNQSPSGTATTGRSRQRMWYARSQPSQGGIDSSSSPRPHTPHVIASASAAGTFARGGEAAAATTLAAAAPARTRLRVRHALQPFLDHGTSRQPRSNRAPRRAPAERRRFGRIREAAACRASWAAARLGERRRAGSFIAL